MKALTDGNRLRFPSNSLFEILIEVGIESYEKLLRNPPTSDLEKAQKKEQFLSEKGTALTNFSSSIENSYFVNFSGSAPDVSPTI